MVISNSPSVSALSVRRSEVLRPCPVCGGEDFIEKYGPVKQCARCGLGMVNPLMGFRGENETKDYFLNEYLPVMLAGREGSMCERAWHLRQISRLFSIADSSRLLDVGCALGFMLEAAQACGWHAQGVETSAFAARYAEKNTGCEVYPGTLEQANFPAESFDAVTLMDVIEHVPHPERLLKEIYRTLRPGGVVYIVTPNFGSLFVHLYGLRAYAIWPDQHVVYFNPHSMKTLLSGAGFRQLRIITKDIYGPNLQRLMRKSSAKNEIKAAFVERRGLRILRDAANRFFAYVPLGDKLIACAQK
jgi:SAM-dependent methyltransferase